MNKVKISRKQVFLYAQICCSTLLKKSVSGVLTMGFVSSVQIQTVMTSEQRVSYTHELFKVPGDKII